MCFAPQVRTLFDISTSKSAPNLVCFAHFDLEMCFAPQLFHHLNFQKWSENGLFCTFWLGYVLRATTACTFSTSQLPKVLRTSKGALSMVCFVHFDFEMPFAWQLFLSHLARWLRTRRFSEPTFDPPEPQIIEKTQCFATFLPFRARLHLLSSQSFSSLVLSLLLFSSLTLPTSAFPSVHIVGSLTSKLTKLPSIGLGPLIFWHPQIIF